MPAVARTEVLPARGRRAIALAIAAAHLGAAWLLAPSRLALPAPASGTPLQVALIAAPVSRPPVTTLPRPHDLAPPVSPRIAEPVITIAAESAPAAPRSDAAKPEATAAPAPAAVVETPPGPKAVPPSALRYIVPPPLDYPVASRQLRESGTVVLRVVVDAQGRPKQIALQRSSGFARLDEQALAAMRKARFAPCTERGLPIECESSAALAYDLEN